MGVTTTSSYSTVAAGDTTGTAAKIAAAITAVNALASPTTAWTPTLGGGWAIGNGTIDCNYTQVGKMAYLSGTLTWGSTSTFGGSALTISMPGSLSAARRQNISCDAYDTSAFGTFQSGARVQTTTIQPFCTGATAGSAERTLISTVPFTWATGDSVAFNGWVEVS